VFSLDSIFYGGMVAVGIIVATAIYDEIKINAYERNLRVPPCVRKGKRRWIMRRSARMRHRAIH